MRADNLSSPPFEGPLVLKELVCNSLTVCNGARVPRGHGGSIIPSASTP